MTTGLNPSQSRKVAGKRQSAGRKGGYKPETLDRLAAFAHRHHQATGDAPTVGEMCAHMGCSYPTAVLLWRELVNTQRVSAEMADQREAQKFQAKAGSRHLHAGPCTPETADRLFNLIKNDIEARIAFFELLRGNIRRPE